MTHDEGNLVRLASVRTEMEGGIIVSSLEEHGIPATMTGIYTANFRTEAPGMVHVLVASADLPRAEAVLEEVHRERGEIDWSQVDVGEPEDE